MSEINETAIEAAARAMTDRVHELEVALSKAIERMKTVRFENPDEQQHWDLEIAKLKFLLGEH